MVVKGLNECLVTEVLMDKNIFFSCVCILPVQAQYEFEEFFKDLTLLLSNVNDVNVTLSVIKGDFDIVYVVKPR